FSSIISFD
ncbi:hypothetical protein CP04DC42_1018B, partial [Chlamydia psittaci 04DC42]